MFYELNIFFVHLRNPDVWPISGVRRPVGEGGVGGVLAPDQAGARGAPDETIFFFEKVGKYIFLLFNGNFVKGFHSQVSHWRAQYVLPVDLAQRRARQEYRARNHNADSLLPHIFLIKLKLSKSIILSGPTPDFD